MYKKQKSIQNNIGKSITFFFEKTVIYKVPPRSVDADPLGLGYRAGNELTCNPPISVPIAPH